MTNAAFLVEEAYKTFAIQNALEHKEPCSCDGCLWLRMYKTYREEQAQIDNSGLKSYTATRYCIVCQYGTDDCMNCDNTVSWYESEKDAIDAARYYGWQLVDDK